MEWDQTITLTFGECAENHVNMQKLGTMADKGFTIEELENIQEHFDEADLDTELYYLNLYLDEPAEEAGILIIRNVIKNEFNFMMQLLDLKPDTKALMYGRVVNKHARHNLCFADYNQDPDYKEGKGTIVSFDKVPLLKKFREKLPRHMGKKAKKLYCEANYYYDPKCGIGFHGDAERKIVIAVRLGDSMPLHYHWFKNGKAIGRRAELMLHGGDVYIMSEKATGHDWKTKKKPTLRHAAGADKYLKIK